MKRTILVALGAAGTIACGAGHAVTTGIDYHSFSKAMGKFYLTEELGTPGGPDYRFFYADKSGHVHIYKIGDNGAFETDWEVTTLGSKATSLIVEDLYGDGKQKLAMTSINGRFLLYDVATYQLEWENVQQRFTRVDHAVVANLDQDRQLEVIILADDVLWIFDSYNRAIQWNSTTKVFAKFIAVGNVDDDPQPEIVLNNGVIFDGRFYNIQFQTDQAFGDRIALADFTGDGYFDIVGEFPDRTLRVFDVWRGREVW
jgi:hypothetical protein